LGRIDDPADLAFAREHVFPKLQYAAAHESSMDQIIFGWFCSPRLQLWPRESFRVVDWNIERGTRLESILEFLRNTKPI